MDNRRWPRSVLLTSFSHPAAKDGVSRRTPEQLCPRRGADGMLLGGLALALLLTACAWGDRQRPRTYLPTTATPTSSLRGVPAAEPAARGAAAPVAQPTFTPNPSPASESKPTPGQSEGQVPKAGAQASAIGVGSRIPWKNGRWFLHGANVPWFNWSCDFGCGVQGGVSDPAVRAQLDAAFRQARAGGVRVLRWWLFPGDPWQIARDADGTPRAITPAVYADLDAALRLAEAHDLYYEFTLFSGPAQLPASWLWNADQRQRLAEVLGTLFARYRGQPHILAWDVVNEPEWDIWARKVGWQEVAALVRAVAQAAHTHGTAYVTVGTARLDGLGLWTGLGLDFYQVHWYDTMGQPGHCARCTDYATVQAAYGLDGPLIIGEFYAGPDTDALARFQDFYRKGYAGALAWSLFAERTNDHMRVDLTATAAFARAVADAGPR